jgi:hypothetical protein
MKYFRSLAVLIAIFSLSIVAKAAPADFKFQVLDPIGPGAPLDGGPFAVTLTLGACPSEVATFDSQTNAGLFGCYLGTNDTGNTINSITLVFSDDLGLNSQTADCLNSGAGDLTAAFATSTCSLVTQGYVLTYSGGAGLAPGATVALAEYGPDPADFGTGVGTVTELTPEPSSILLLSTGVLCVGVMLFRKRVNLLAH